MEKKLLIIGFVWPEPRSSAAGIRMMQLIETFLQDNFVITFATACSRSDNAIDLNGIGVNTVEIVLNHSSFDDFVKNLNPDVVVFDRFMTEEQFGWRVAECCPKALRILDTEDLHCLRKGRQLAFKEHQSFHTNYLFNEFAKREIASIYRCDLSLIISEAEMSILNKQFHVDDKLLYYIPFLLNPISNDDIKALPKFEERQHFITIGNFLHEPNYQSVLQLKNNIWPKIKKRLPLAEMHVYGAYAGQKVNQLHNDKDGFLIMGFTEDVNRVMQKARVCLAPLQFGAGLKGKLVDAMQNGTPFVTTKVGAEGLFDTYNINEFITDNPELFAQNAAEIYSNQNLWNQNQKVGFNLIKKRFNRTLFQDDFLKKINSLCINLIQHRRDNFIGMMLQHHTLQSTKFMSKWIEEKHKKIT